MDSFERIKRILPPQMARELETVVRGRVGGFGALGEIRLTAEGRCGIVHHGEPLLLSSSVGRNEMEKIYERASGGSLYAHRETVKAGYLMIGGGIRLGISGRARYDGGELIGISDIKNLVLRLPISYCDFEDKLMAAVNRGIGSGLLIYSPPAYGKTTALRFLARKISARKRLVIVDERGEFDTGEIGNAVILSGYRKSLGIEIATRTHSPEIIMIDEIGADDVEPLMLSLKCGVPVIASVHAGSFAELLEKKMLEPLIENRAFSTFIGIGKRRGKYILKRNRFQDIAKAKEKQTAFV